MLSTENPLPDPSEIPQLKSGCSNFISRDEKASDNDNNNLAQLEVDLFKSGLDDINQTLPKFSIRDYVFSTRGRDIKTHWPFSPKNLHLCLKHGVKDVLPPFETLEYVRNSSSIFKCVDKNTSNPSVKLSGSNNHLLSVSNVKSNPSKKDEEYYPSSTRSLSCSDVNSVLFRTKSPFLEPESENLPDLEKPKFAIRANKVKSINTQNPAKKCRLIVKLGNNIAEQKPNEDFSETMASKVCPVCKTFTSSSNTTLNAHIDQCLSGESPVKWTANPKVIKHRIKPRKTRLMADIYETAICCTLEDLDRRNGTSWALNLGFPAQDLELCDEKKNNNQNSFVISEDKKEEGAVYFDSSGTKVRILSRFSDVKPNTNGEDDCGTRKLVEREKGKKIVSSKKQQHFVERHKLLKCPSYEQRRCSPRLDCCPEACQVNNAEEMKFPTEQNEKEDLAEPLEAWDHQMQSNDPGMIKQWVSSKRTVHKKKKNPDHKSHHPSKIIKNLKIKSHLPLLDHDKLIEKTSDSRFAISSDDNSLSATDQSHKRKYDDEYMEQQPCQTNRAGFSLLDSRDYHDKKNHMMFSKNNFKRPKEKGPSVPNDSGNHAVSRINKKMRSISSTVNIDSPFISSRLSKHEVFSSGGKEFGSVKKTSGGKKLSPFSKNPFSIRHASVSESKKYLGRNNLDFKKSAIHMQNNPVETRVENAARMEKDSGNLPIERSRVLKIRKKRWGFLKTAKEGDTSSKHSNASSESNSHGDVQNISSFVSDDIPAGSSNSIKVVEIHDEFFRDPILKISGGEPLIDFGKSLAYEGHCSPDLVLSGEQEMLCGDKVNVNDAEGNYFVDVDTIPIPGPPGSFLPSPGRMGSEELHGNSSLTTCRIHSSEDNELGLIDHMDSSDSPCSDTSFVSNSIAARSDSVLPFRSHAVQCDIFENRTDIVADGPKLYEPKAKLVIPETKFSIFGDCESPNLSTSNPVLRLMGKNLLVANKEEINLSPQTRPTQSSVVSNFPNLHSSVGNVISIGNIQNGDRPFYHNLSRGPSFLDNSQKCMQTQQHFDFSSSVGSSVCSNFKTEESCPHLSRVMLSSRLSNEGLRSSSEHREYAGEYVFTHDQLGSTIRLDNPIRHEVEKVHTFVPQLRTSDSCGGKRKEIIVIDDSPENGPSLGFKTTYRENMEDGGSSIGILKSRALGCYDSRHANSFYSYQTRCYPFSGGSQMIRNANTQVPPSFKGTDGNSVNNWNINRTLDGPSAIRPDSLTALSPSTGHQRSSLYFSPGFSLHANFT